MTDNSRERNLEYGLYLLAFGLALAIRLLRLGEIPLGDDEARWALQALDLAKGLRPIMGPQPAYVILTGLVFFAVQASNFAARLVPALFGAALSLVPFQFRDRLGSKPALVLAFFLAFDPSFLALSRLAGSPILAISALMLAWGAMRNGKIRTAGVWTGVALLSGSALWPGVIGLALAYGLLRGFFVLQSGRDAGKAPLDDEPSEENEELPDDLFEEMPQTPVFSLPALPDGKTWLTLALSAAGTYVLLGSLFLLASGGLSAGLASIPAYFGGWLGFPNVPLQRLLLGLGVYETLALLLALTGLVRGILKRDQLTIMLGLWLLVALVLALAYPSRQVADLGWVVLPLLSLAAVEFAGYLEPIIDGRWETISMAVFTSAILIFAALNYFAIALTPMDPTDVQLRWWILFGSIGLLVISLAMVAFGWSFPTAVQGGLWGSLLVLFIYTFATTLASAGLRTYRTYELWPASPYISQADNLVSQMNDLSRWKMGTKTAMDVTIAGVDSPALRWLLRDWNVTILPAADLAGTTPSLVISTDKSAVTAIASAYRGEDVSWRTAPLWDQGLMSDWLSWSILHGFPKDQEKLILWARSDVFIDSQNLK